MSKKVVIVANSFWNFYNYRLNLINALKQNGYEVYLLANKDEYYKKFNGYNRIVVSIDTKGKSIFNDLKTLIDFIRIYNKIKPDIVLNFNIKPNIYSSFAAMIVSMYSQNIKVINNITGLGISFNKKSLISKLIILLYKFSSKKVYKVIFQNKDDLLFFLNYRIIKKEQADLVPGSGVDINVYKSSKKTFTKNNPFIFSFISRLIKEKGIIEFIEAAKLIKKKYNNVKFYVIGPFEKEHPSSIDESYLNLAIKEKIICYKGFTDNVKKWLDIVDCVVLPSYYREGVPHILIQSASMGKPIITTNNVGCKEIVEDNFNGYLCKIKDPIDLAKKMEKILLANEEELKIFSKNSRKKVEDKFSDQIIIDKYLSLLKNI